jgi:hypothetical protein
VDRGITTGADVAQDALHYTGGVQFGPENAADGFAHSGRQFRRLKGETPEEQLAPFFQAADYAHWR